MQYLPASFGFAQRWSCHDFSCASGHEITVASSYVGANQTTGFSRLALLASHKAIGKASKITDDAVEPSLIK